MTIYPSIRRRRRDTTPGTVAAMRATAERATEQDLDAQIENAVEMAERTARRPLVRISASATEARVVIPRYNHSTVALAFRIAAAYMDQGIGDVMQPEIMRGRHGLCTVVSFHGPAGWSLATIVQSLVSGTYMVEMVS